LHEQLGQGGEVTAAELADGAEVRPVQRGHRLESKRSSQARAIRRDE
jgi:hypothetical protein